MFLPPRQARVVRGSHTKSMPLQKSLCQKKIIKKKRKKRKKGGVGDGD